MPKCTEGAPLLVGGERVWQDYDDIQLNNEVFEQLGTDFEATGAVQRGYVGSAETRLFSQRAAVDFAVNWMMNHS